jgi:heme A synthase
MSEEKDGTSKAVKLIAAITGLLVAIGTLVGAITVTLGKNDPSPYQGGMTIILDSPEAYATFLENHPG